MQYDPGPNCTIITLMLYKTPFSLLHRQDDKAEDYWREEDASLKWELEQGFVYVWTKTYLKTKSKLNPKHSQLPRKHPDFTREHALLGHVCTSPNFKTNSLLTTQKASSQQLTGMHQLAQLMPKTISEVPNHRNPQLF